jgi:hypothetical protein
MQAISRIAIVDRGPSLIRPVAVVPIRADDDVGVAVAVHVPRRAGRIAKVGRSPVAFGGR